jgi:hypothetical protein
MSDLTIEGALPVGLDFAGKTHKTFKLRPAKVRDTIEVTTEVGVDDNLKFMLGILSRLLISLGDIPKENITSELLAELYDVDLAELQLAQEKLEKKLRPPKTA